MKKLLLVSAALFSSAAMADCNSENWDSTATGGECAESNTVVVENTVDVFSSRQNVFLCNILTTTKTNKQITEFISLLTKYLKERVRL